ncbi:MAG TPA: FtsX-like permease family protein [Candidatus Koribacter sp.]|jgi:putative ABC transport system permease protein
MKYLPLLFRNILRKKTRLLLTIGSFAIALFLFGILAIVNHSFNAGLDVAGVDRLMVQNRVSIIQPVPLAYKEKIEQVKGVKSVSFANWFGGVYQDEKNFFPQYAIDDETYRAMYPEFKVSDAEWKGFMDDREGVIVGEKTAKRYGFKIGDRVPLKGILWNSEPSWSFNIRGIYTAGRPDEDTSQFWLHWKLFDERRAFGKGTVGWYMVKIDNPDDAVRISKEIDAMFANSSTETKTQTEKEMMVGWAKQTGNIGLMITIIGSIVFFTLLLVIGNTMAMSIRERYRELAVLKAIGYTDTFILFLVMAEALLVAGIGILLGLGMLLAALPGIQNALGGFLQAIYLPPNRALLGIGITFLVAFLAGILPAVNASRLRVVDAIRRV